MDIIEPKIEEGWRMAMRDEFQKESFKELKKFLIKEKKNYTVYPLGTKIFAAFDQTPFNEVKVVILGQDPYHGYGQAHGLSFSVPNGIKPPPSLMNIFKELKNDLQIQIPNTGNLENWAKQGALLLNATLTVRASSPGSHQKQGWEEYTDAVIRKLSDQKEGIVFLLWGKYAKAKKDLIDTNKHHILTATHPSPFSANYGFFGCRHFSKTNEILRQYGKSEIYWNLS